MRSHGCKRPRATARSSFSCCCSLLLALHSAAGQGIDSSPATISRSKHLKSLFPELPDGFHTDPDSITVALGPQHTCALESRPGVELGGPARCWGRNDKGQSAPPDDAMFVQLSAGTSHTCGVKVDQTLACWGAFRGAPGGLYQQVSAGSAHTCALTEHGTVVCWGDNAFGKCRHPGGADFVQVAAGGTFSCALRRNGLAQCWGDDSLGQASPPEGVQFRQIDASPTGHACGVTVAAAAVTGKSGSKSGNGGGGDVVCWGRNFDGEAAPRAGPFRQVSCGAYSTCAISAVDDTAACWGATRTSSRGPFYELVIAHAHACGIGADGGLQCWGSASGAERVPDGFQVA